MNQRIAVNRWTTTVQQDNNTQEYYIPLPQDMLEALGWCEGDTLVWSVTTDESGAIAVLKRVDPSDNWKSNRDIV